MMRWMRWAVGVSILTAAVITGCTDGGEKVMPGPEPPVIDAATPDSAAAGETIRLDGRNFGPEQGTSQVLFGPVPADQVDLWNDTRIDAVVPDGASSGNLRVVVGGLSSNLVAIEIAPPPPPPPVITSVEPDSAGVGAQIHVEGQNFGSAQGTSRIFFGVVEAVVESWSDADIHPLVPDLPEGSLTIRVVVDDRVSNEVSFFVAETPPPPPGPEIERLFPVRTVVSDTVEVVGTGFSGGAETEVTFAGPGGRLPATILEQSDTSIRVLVPDEAVDGDVVVRVDAVASPGAPFSVAPEIITYSGHLLPQILHPKGCTSCHGGERHLFLDTAEAALRGDSEHGPVILPRNAEESLIILKVLPNPPIGERMPAGCESVQNCLTAEQVLLMKDWINQGARDN